MVHSPDKNSPIPPLPTSGPSIKPLIKYRCIMCNYEETTPRVRDALRCPNCDGPTVNEFDGELMGVQPKPIVQPITVRVDEGIRKHIDDKQTKLQHHLRAMARLIEAIADEL